VGAIPIHAGRTTDGGTDMAKVIGALENYVNVPKRMGKVIIQ
jgi:hypothetical protein